MIDKLMEIPSINKVILFYLILGRGEAERMVVYHLHGQTGRFTVWVGLGKW